MRYDELFGKRLLLLGGIPHAMEIVKTAHKMGVQVYVTDYFETSPCKKIADKAFMVSTTDVDAVCKLCEDEKIDGIITGFIDSMLPYCSEICKKLGKPFWGTKEQIDICVSKDKFKTTCREYQVPVAEEYHIAYDIEGNINEADTRDIKYPVIIKPVDNSGSRGVYICNDDRELKSNIKKSLSYSKSKNIIIEEYLQGQHINAYYTLVDGEVYLSAIADRFVDYLDHTSAPLPVCLVHPSKYLAQFEAEVSPAIVRMFKGLKMENGVAFVQGFRCNDGSIKMYEMGYRLNGGGTYSLIEACCGYHQIEMLIRYSLTGKMGEEAALRKASPKFDKFAINYVLSVPKGNIGTINGLEDLYSIEGVKNVVQVRFDGDSVSGNGGSAQVIAYVLFVVNSIEGLEHIVDEIKNTVAVSDVSGNDISVIPVNMEEIRQYYSEGECL